MHRREIAGLAAGRPKRPSPKHKEHRLHIRDLRRPLLNKAMCGTEAYHYATTAAQVTCINCRCYLEGGERLEARTRPV